MVIPISISISYLNRSRAPRQRILIVQSPDGSVSLVRSCILDETTTLLLASFPILYESHFNDISMHLKQWAYIFFSCCPWDCSNKKFGKFIPTSTIWRATSTGEPAPRAAHGHRRAEATGITASEATARRGGKVLRTAVGMVAAAIASASGATPGITGMPLRGAVGGPSGGHPPPTAIAEPISGAVVEAVAAVPVHGYS